MRKTVKATIGVTTVAGALAMGGSAALACTSGSTGFASGTGDDSWSPTAATTDKSDTTTQTPQFSVTDEVGGVRTVSFDETDAENTNALNTGAASGQATEEPNESTTAQSRESEDENRTAPAAPAQVDRGHHHGEVRSAARGDRERSRD